MKNHRKNARPGTDPPRFPICGLGREGCSLLGFHGHLSPMIDEERERIQRWRAQVDSDT